MLVRPLVVCLIASVANVAVGRLLAQGCASAVGFVPRYQIRLTDGDKVVCQVSKGTYADIIPLKCNEGYSAEIVIVDKKEKKNKKNKRRFGANITCNASQRIRGKTPDGTTFDTRITGGMATSMMCTPTGTGMRCNPRYYEIYPGTCVTGTGECKIDSYLPCNGLKVTDICKKCKTHCVNNPKMVKW
ncbi:hypothetical protein GGI12_005799 [Dipsacomyces acuminosporus]|nr:hypothetical protein GGI12_005799 [Dipsacomyces acuminosporus]